MVATVDINVVDEVRHKLSAARTYYVATTGNDTTGDGSVGTPWATTQKAFNYVAEFIDFAGYSVTIQHANGTYTDLDGDTCVLNANKMLVGQGIDNGWLIIRGDPTTPGNVVFDGSSKANLGIFMQATAVLYLTGIKLNNCDSSIWANGVGSNIWLGPGMEFGAANIHIKTGISGIVNAYASDYTISGGAVDHIYCEESSSVDIEFSTITITGTPAFSRAFAHSLSGGALYLGGNVYTGSATGSRFQADDGIIYAFDASFVDLGLTALPGNAAGTILGVGAYNGITRLDLLVTTRGDLIYRNATVPDRLGIGAANGYLGTDGTDPIWRTDQVRVLGKSAAGSSHTGNTSETALATITIPAGAMGPNGMVRVYAVWSHTNSGNNKNLRIRFGGIGGTSYYTRSRTASAQEQMLCVIQNRNSAASQVGFNATSSLFSSTTGASTTSAVNTANSTTIVISGELANSGETVTLEAYVVEICYGA